jgi:beta-glucosidase
MTVEEKVAQLCSLLHKDLLENGRLSPAKVRRKLKHGIGFLASVVRDVPVREGVQILTELQTFLTRETRLRIPAVAHEECLSGCMAQGGTLFPQSIGMACSWNPALMGDVAAAIGRETRARGMALALSPVVDVARDARCGRTEESYGEDTLLVCEMAVAFAKAMQRQGVGCTAKHFAANFVADGGRDSHDIHFSERELREVYFPPYQACIREAGVVAVMPNYSTINGRPSSCNRWLLIDLLREEWGFDGITGSDYWAVNRMVEPQGVAPNPAEAARMALMNGMDVEWPDSSCYPTLVEQVRKGRVPMRALDRSVERVLRLKEKLGLFDNPYPDAGRAIEISDSARHRRLARRAARESIVLLKNAKRGGLPFSRGVKKVAVIGPNANTVRTGTYSGTGSRVITPLAGIRERMGRDRVLYARGCPNLGGTARGIREAAKAAGRADAVVLCVGGWSGGSWKPFPHTEGEGRDRCDLRLPGLQEQLIDAVTSVNDRVVVVLIGGSAVVMEHWVGKVRAVLEAWYPGGEGGRAIAEVLFGDYNPGGKLAITFPRTTGQLPCYYNLKPTGRLYDYTDLRGPQARFPFGHGLSYTTFAYGRLTVKRRQGGLDVACHVTNAGKRAGDEVVQLYLHDVCSSLARPLKELKGFRRVQLEPGQTERITFRLKRKDLSYLGPKLKPVFEPGAFEIMIGSSSEDIRLRKTVKV